MATVSRQIPEFPNLEVPEAEARELLDLWTKAEPKALDRVRRRIPEATADEGSAKAPSKFDFTDAQRVIAREYGFSEWWELKERIEANAQAHELAKAIHANDREAATRVIEHAPQLLHIPLLSGNWGPPMSHAANLGRLEIIQAMAALGARDHQHAFDRAVLQGRLECARWLHEHGATLQPGIIMGACETLNSAGFRFLAELNAPFTNERGDSLAPLALVLETYGRNPDGKHAILNTFAERGYQLPDTPMMALHRGDIPALEKHLKQDARLLERTFTLAEIYPRECGCAEGGLAGMHWTPIDGTTLLHLAIDFREEEIFHWLLSNGANVNAKAAIDAEGFGGHTPLFNALVCGPWPTVEMTRSLLRHGATKEVRASLRKFLDWTEQPRWHEARNVTALEWAKGFPEKGYVNEETLSVLSD